MFNNDKTVKITFGILLNIQKNKNFRNIKNTLSVIYTLWHGVFIPI